MPKSAPANAAHDPKADQGQPEAVDKAAIPMPAHANEPDSPCVAVCSTLFDDVCRGCGRTVMEVSEWVTMSPAQKRAIWVRIRAEGYPRRES